MAEYVRMSDALGQRLEWPWRWRKW